MTIPVAGVDLSKSVFQLSMADARHRVGGEWLNYVATRNCGAVVLREFCGTLSCIVVLYPACVTTGVPASH